LSGGLLYHLPDQEWQPLLYGKPSALLRSCAQQRALRRSFEVNSERDYELPFLKKLMKKEAHKNSQAKGRTYEKFWTEKPTRRDELKFFKKGLRILNRKLYLRRTGQI
jgi:hypothetical protein